VFWLDATDSRSLRFCKNSIEFIQNKIPGVLFQINQESHFMFNRVFLLCGLIVAALVTGCAHPISVTADVAQLKSSGKPRIEKSVAYVIAPQDRDHEVVTPGGGGDKVSYKPYRDLDAGIYKALSEVFANVTRVDTVTELSKPGAHKVQLVFIPKITTHSSSTSMLTWPPTVFTVDLTCKVSDANGAPLTDVTVTGEGKAEFAEFKADHSLAAKRAAQDAMQKLVKTLEENPAIQH
jgi:hypothetical protein